MKAPNLMVEIVDQNQASASFEANIFQSCNIQLCPRGSLRSTAIHLLFDGSGGGKPD